MILSMTGFAAAEARIPPDGARGTLALELRSVNARYLDIQFRIHDDLRALEPLLREALAAKLARGKIDCRLFLNDSAGAQTPDRLNAEALARLKELAAEVARALPQAAPLRVADVLRWPGVLAEAPRDEAQTRTLAAELCRKALDELVAARAREGEKLAAAVRERVAAMRERIEHVVPMLPKARQAYETRLTERLREAIGSADDERIRAEVALFAAKSDVDEELTRLRAHLAEVERALKQGGAVGKRLDFLAQELNREANTLASKAASAEIADCALELKLLIEQVREQVQNIE